MGGRGRKPFAWTAGYPKQSKSKDSILPSPQNHGQVLQAREKLWREEAALRRQQLSALAKTAQNDQLPGLAKDVLRAG